MQKFHKIDGVEAVIISDSQGNILESSNELPYQQNIVLMGQNLYTKAHLFIKDFVNQHMEQLVFKFSSGFVLITQINDDKIVLILSSDKSNLGILLRETNNN